MNDYATYKLLPVIGPEGIWMSAASQALRDAMGSKDFAGAISILNDCDTTEIGVVLSENGFGSPVGLTKQDRDNLLVEIQYDLNEACALGVNGFELDQIRQNKNINVPSMQSRSLHEFAETGIHEDLDHFYRNADFITDKYAAQDIQKILKHKNIDVMLLGSAGINERDVLLFIAGQGLERDVQGFSFDGIEGKYHLPGVTLPEIVDLHVAAASSVAEESVRFALGEWVDGKKISPISDLVPDSVSQFLRVPLNVPSAMGVIKAIQNGTVRQHAAKQGRFQFSQIMAGMGYDINADTIQQQASVQGLAITEPDRRKGDYIVTIVGKDHKSYLASFAREKAIEIPKSELDKIAIVPSQGAELRIKYKEGEISASLKADKNQSVER